MVLAERVGDELTLDRHQSVVRVAVWTAHKKNAMLRKRNGIKFVPHLISRSQFPLGKGTYYILATRDGSLDGSHFRDWSS